MNAYSVYLTPPESSRRRTTLPHISQLVGKGFLCKAACLPALLTTPGSAALALGHVKCTFLLAEEGGSACCHHHGVPPEGVMGEEL